LNKTVAAGGTFETITFSNVQTFNRDTWNIWFFNFKESGDVVAVDGFVHEGFPVGTAVETVTVNGQKYEITFVVTAPESSSSVTSSSSSALSSSSESPVSSSSENPLTSSSAEPESSSSEGTTVAMSRVSNPLSMAVAGRTLHVSGASDMSVEVFDMQGSPVATFAHVKGSVNLEMLRQGSFVVRLRAGSNCLVRRIVVK
jgi:cytoskeletal protein RodZ